MLLALALSLLSQTTVPSDRGPDIVLFLLDDVAAIDLERVPTPNIDALASRGVLFERGYGQPVCAPSRWSLMLSEWKGENAGLACQYPGSPRVLSHGEDNLPRAMEGAGYRTAFFGRWGLGGNVVGDPDDYPWTPTLWGFEWVEEVVIDGVSCLDPDGDYFSWPSVTNGEQVVSNEYLTTAATDAFVRWWPNVNGPRFAVLSFLAAHSPFHWPPASAMPAGWVQPPINLPSLQFDAMIQSIDVAVGRALASIDLSRTLVVLVADNGTPKPVAPILVRNKVKSSVFERGVRVPFVVAGRDVPAGGRCTTPVSVVDLLPTFVELAGGTPLPHYDGQSLLPALHGEALGRRWAYVTKGPVSDHALIEERWKLFVKGNGEELLYDLINDPLELDGIPAEEFDRPEVLARLRARVRQARL